MIAILFILYAAVVLLTVLARIQNQKIENMRQIMERERPIFAAMKIQEGIKNAIKKTKDDVEFIKLMEKNFQ